MEEIKKRLDVMQVINLKNDKEKQARLKQLTDMRVKYEAIKLQKSKVQSSLINCNESITKQYQSTLDIESIKLLNKFAEKLEQDLVVISKEYTDAKVELDKAIDALNMTLKKGEAYQRIISDVSQEHTRLKEKSFEKNVEDIWMSRRGVEL
jgi:hypothetical protein